MKTVYYPDKRPLWERVTAKVLLAVLWVAAWRAGWRSGPGANRRQSR